MNTQNHTWQQAALNELRELEAIGVKLPMSPEEIVQIEAQGDLVDLNTGAIIQGGAMHRIAVTKQGREMAAIIQVENCA